MTVLHVLLIISKTFFFFTYIWTIEDETTVLSPSNWHQSPSDMVTNPRMETLISSFPGTTVQFRHWPMRMCSSSGSYLVLWHSSAWPPEFLHLVLCYLTLITTFLLKANCSHSKRYKKFKYLIVIIIIFGKLNFLHQFWDVYRWWHLTFSC